MTVPGENFSQNQEKSVQEQNYTFQGYKPTFEDGTYLTDIEATQLFDVYPPRIFPSDLIDEDDARSKIAGNAFRQAYELMSPEGQEQFIVSINRRDGWDSHSELERLGLFEPDPDENPEDFFGS